jgi:hypothetical protein
MSFGETFTHRASFGGFVVQEPRVLGRAAPFSHRKHGHHPIVWADPHAQRVADVHLFGRFRPASVDLDFATGDRGRCERARFEEAGRPEPAVEPYG